MTKKQGNRKAKGPAIAVTGVNGFLGSSLLHMLEGASDYPRIIAIDYRTPPFRTKKSEFYRMDLTETLADSKLAEIFKKENVTRVIHAAFPETPPHDVARVHELQSIGTMYLLNACAAQRIQKLVMTSTTDVYGALPSNPNYLTEDHLPRGGYKSSFIRDKIDAENQALGFAARHPETVVTILRPCTILGPRVRNFKTNFLQRPVVFTVMGYDPLMQFVHEEDVVRAFRSVLDGDHPGVYNIVGKGVLPLSQILYLAGKVAFAMPAPILYTAAWLVWYANLVQAPVSHIDFLKYLCVADGAKAEKVLGFVPKYSSREAVLSFIGAERLRKVHLLKERYRRPA